MCDVRTPLDVVVLMLSCIRELNVFMEATQEITVIELFVTRQKAKQKAHPASQCKLRMMLMP